MTQETLRIGSRAIGEGQPVFVIAEAGVNHNGDPELARALVHEAKACGAHCVKFQTFKAERIVIPAAPKADYQLRTTAPEESQLAMLRKLELPADVYPTLMKVCVEAGIEFLSTPYSAEDVEFLDALGVHAFKVASGQIAEPPFLRAVASRGKPVLLSTGMATLAEVDEAVRTIRAAGHDQLVLLQCTTNYPSEVADANLRAMVTMRTAFGVSVGYSDHTQTETACIAAVALGACVVEKHFTLDRRMPGPDHSSSAEPAEFRRLVGLIRETEAALGRATKEPTAAERRNMEGMRRSIVSAVPIFAGTTITAAMLTFKRPATGIPPGRLDEVVGRLAGRDIPPDTILRYEWLR